MMQDWEICEEVAAHTDLVGNELAEFVHEVSQFLIGNRADEQFKARISHLVEDADYILDTVLAYC